MSSTIVIDGKTYVGSNIKINNGKVVIDGVAQDQTVQGVVEIRVEGTLEKLECDAAVTCGEVTGDVSAGGNVHCGNVSGSVNGGGSVRCEDVGGSVNAGGSVRMNRATTPGMKT